MSSSLENIEEFINNHHVMSLATSYENELSVCSLFYAYDASSQSFVVASSLDTIHIGHINKNQNIAGNILLETKKVGEIKGLQFQGKFRELYENRLKLLYFKTFPYALALVPKLWQIKVDSFKMTDNSLGFGKKLIWPEVSE